MENINLFLDELETVQLHHNKEEYEHFSMLPIRKIRDENLALGIEQYSEHLNIYNYKLSRMAQLALNESILLSDESVERLENRVKNILLNHQACYDYISPYHGPQMRERMMSECTILENTIAEAIKSNDRLLFLDAVKKIEEVKQLMNFESFQNISDTLKKYFLVDTNSFDEILRKEETIQISKVIEMLVTRIGVIKSFLEQFTKTPPPKDFDLDILNEYISAKDIERFVAFEKELINLSGCFGENERWKRPKGELAALVLLLMGTGIFMTKERTAKTEITPTSMARFFMSRYRCDFDVSLLGNKTNDVKATLTKELTADMYKHSLFR